MHYFVFPNKDSYISSGSNIRSLVHNKFADETWVNKNFGQDEILELKKGFRNKSFDYQTRMLLQFDLTDLSSSIVSGDISSDSVFHLKLWEAEGNSGLSGEYELAAYPLSQSWDEGTGHDYDRPKITEGVSWENREYPQMGTAVTWSNADGTNSNGGTFDDSDTNLYRASQSFSYNSPDIDMDITKMVNGWLDGSLTNNGLILKFSGSQETDNTTHGDLRFFSKQSNTIFLPVIDTKWDNHIIPTGSTIGSLTELDTSGDSDNYVYPIGLREKYRETEKVKFRFGARKRYIQKTFSTSVQTASGSYIPEGSGSYSIVDVASGEKIIDFSKYTKLSADTKSNYFIQYLNGLFPDRTYKILLKVKYDDGQEYIYDDDFEFKIVR